MLFMLTLCPSHCHILIKNETLWRVSKPCDDCCHTGLVTSPEILHKNTKHKTSSWSNSASSGLEPCISTKKNPKTKNNNFYEVFHLSTLCAGSCQIVDVISQQQIQPTNRISSLLELRGVFTRWPKTPSKAWGGKDSNGWIA